MNLPTAVDPEREDRRWMREALLEAAAAADEGEVPVGAVVVDGRGALVARTHNRSIATNDPTAHAEILALRAAARAAGNYRLTGTTLYVTLEPCAMCAGALTWARVSRLVYGSQDARAGAVDSLFGIPTDRRLNHQVEVTGGVMAEESRTIMQDFFRRRRGGGRDLPEDPPGTRFLGGEVPKRS